MAKVQSKELTVELKYFEGAPVIEKIQRASRPGLRVYRGKEESAEGAGWTRCCHRIDVGGRHERSSRRVKKVLVVR